MLNSAFLSASCPCPSPPPGMSSLSPLKRLKIGVLTSGGDSQGMNAAIRSVVRMALSTGCTPYAIHEGYEGLVQGGDMIKPFSWNDVAQIINLGGTIIGSARCMSFRSRPGRLRAAENLINLGIHSLVVIGGDGSLTGAELLRSEWKGLVEELQNLGRIPIEALDLHPVLSISGLVGSIDNDMIGTEMTIGSNTALHRIIEAIDAVTTSAHSHQRVFIVEVMGRHCGWLALMAAVASGADWLLLPEVPSPIGIWEEEMCAAIQKVLLLYIYLILKNRQLGKRQSFIILSEGAIDTEGNLITCKRVKEALFRVTGIEARSIVLGHVQRGGITSAFDRIMATLQGVHAVHALLQAERKEEGDAVIIGIQESQICRLPLNPCVTLTRSIDDTFKNGELEKAFKLRDADFKEFYHIAQSMSSAHEVPWLRTVGGSKKQRLAIVHNGPPCGGMNSATFSIVRYAISNGCIPIGILGGWLCVENMEPVKYLGWMDVDGWIGQGGSWLGTSRKLPSEVGIDRLAELFKEHKIESLFIIGGFEAWLSLRQFEENKNRFPSLNIPMVVIPATISNNVPGSEISLGADTALNMIVNSCDTIRLSASSSRRTFVVEVQGGNCGYLALMGGIASASTYSYLPEEKMCLSDVLRESTHLKNRFLDDKKQGRIIIFNECCSQVLTAEVLANLLEGESSGLYDARVSKLGHLQQGREPSPFDRLLATRLAVLAVDYVLKGNDKSVVAGIMNGRAKFSDIATLLPTSDDVYRRTLEPSWMKNRPISQILSKYSVNPDILAASLVINDGILPQLDSN